MTMEKTAMSITNEGTLDRIIRIGVGAAVLSLVFVGPKTPWGWLGLVPVLTGLIGYCPLYALLGIRTCPLRK
jgi:hypothetical protein